jgi:hypothetical protein
VFDLRRGEDFFFPGQVCGGRDEKVSDSGRCRLMSAVSLSDMACSCARIGWTRWRSRRAPRAGALAAWQALFCTAIRVVASSRQVTARCIACGCYGMLVIRGATARMDRFLAGRVRCAA